MNITTQKQNLLPHILLILAVIGWASMYIFIKQVAPEVHTLNIAFSRYLFATLFFAPFVLHKVRRIESRDIAPIIIFSLLNASIATILNIWATTLSTASNASIIVNSNPLIIIVLAPFFIGERTSWRAKIGALIGFVGLYIVIFQGLRIQSLLKSQYIFGNIVALGSASIIAISTIYLKQYIQKYSALTITFYTFACSLILLLIIILSKGLIFEFPTSLPLLLPLIGFGTISTIIPFLGFNYGVEQIGASKAAVYKMCIPILTTILAWFILSEQLTMPTLIGMILTLYGIYTVQKN